MILMLGLYDENLRKMAKLFGARLFRVIRVRGFLRGSHTVSGLISSGRLIICVYSLPIKEYKAKVKEEICEFAIDNAD